MRSRSPLPDRLPGAVRDTVRGWLEHPRYEVLPVAGVTDEVAEHAPPGATVTVTASPRQGLEPTLATTTALANAGFRAVPHLAARLLRDEVEVKEVVDRLELHEVREVFVVAGDAEHPAGGYSGSVPLVEALQRLAPRLEVGVTGYPETHPRIPDDVAVQAMWDKRDHASYVVSQVCLDPITVVRWLGRVRERGVELPVLVGVPGPVATGQLLRVGSRIGVGESLRFLAGHAGLARLARPGAFDPGPLVRELAGPGPALGVVGVHLYTFNAVAATEAWRRGLLDELGGGRR